MARKTTKPQVATNNANRAAESGETVLLTNNSTPARPTAAAAESPDPIDPSPQQKRLREESRVVPQEVYDAPAQPQKVTAKIFQNQRVALREYGVMDVLHNEGMFFVDVITKYTEGRLDGTHCIKTHESYQDYAALMAGISLWQKRMMSRAARVVIVACGQGRKTVIYLRDVRAYRIGGPYPNWEKNVHFIRTRGPQIPVTTADAELEVPALPKEIFRVEAPTEKLSAVLTQTKTNLAVPHENRKQSSTTGLAAIDKETADVFARSGILMMPADAITTSKYASHMLTVVFNYETQYKEILEVLASIQRNHSVFCAVTSFRGRVLLSRDATTDDANALIPPCYRNKVADVKLQERQNYRKVPAHRDELDINPDQSEDPTGLLLMTSIHGAVPIEMAYSISTGLAQLLPIEECGQVKMVKCDGRSALVRAPQKYVDKWDNTRVNKTYLLSAFSKVLAARKAEQAEYEASMARYAQQEEGHGGDHYNYTVARDKGAQPQRAEV